MSTPHTPLRDAGTAPRITNIQPKQSRASTRQSAPNRGQRLPTATFGNTDPRTTGIPQEEFDEYGAELEPGARVWKTYVKEADKFDTEQVEGWNRSLDVTLIFAALFTAICTAFVIESSKSLKEDPTETSARRLDQIASILLVVAGANDLSQLNSTEIMAPIASEPFSPRPVDLCVNILWFFSLILSAAVSLISMLAKEWCYLFMSGRIGDPWSQTKRRQQRWEGIEKWKMEKVIIFLPSLIHLSFLSFAVGICIYLWDMSPGVAIPAAVVTVVSVLIYVASTILPLLEFFGTECPYSTSISRFIQRLRGADDNKSGKQSPEEAGRIAVGALAWLIKTNENANSTDIALQAVAGAESDTANRQLLKDCGADTMISRRLIALDSYMNNYERISDLYTRAQSFFQDPEQKPLTTSTELTSTEQVANIPTEKVTDTPGKKGTDTPGEKVNAKSNQEIRDRKSSGGVPQKDLHREIQKTIRNLRDTINEQIDAHVTSSGHTFIFTPNNIQALRVGRTAASHCLRSLQNGIQNQTQELFDSAISLLESYRNRDAHLNPKEIEYLMVGIAMLLSSLLVDCHIAIGAQYVMRLLRTASRADTGQNQLRLGYLALPLIVYAISRNDYRGWTKPPPLSPISRSERAIEVIAYYVSHPSKLTDVSSTMINLALLELLSDPEGYKLEDDDVVTISDAFDPAAEEAHIRTFPTKSPPDTFSRTLKSMATIVSKDPNGLFSRNDNIIACLTVLNRTRMDKSTSDAPVGQVYAFVVECVLNLPSLDPEGFGRNVALDLMQRFHSYSGWTEDHILDSAQSLGRRGVIARLQQVAVLEGNDTDLVIKSFAIGQAWFLIDLAIESGTASRQDWRSLSLFVGDENLWDSPDLVIPTLEKQRGALAKQYRAMWEKEQPHHEYLGTIYQSILQAGKSPSES
ncbi:unnamed protein product [Rhizoctonia solani]|uniref:DUF6535 domain-containing protein n=1 Tax=Rhizoctonia solani TaxID=456999 RepID=A0A8H3H3M8_9AGAM|nr:unnamed protein product [Rhizoctonia solani]